MWPSKKKKTGIKLSPGESMMINLPTSWRRDKDEVIIMTDNGPIILDGKNQLFIEIAGDNIDPITVQVVPDFKNRTINFLEIIDPNAKKKFTENGPRLKFAGGIIKDNGISFDDYLKQWDKDIERFKKMVNNYKWIRNIFVPINVILIFLNLYYFITKDNMNRYFNLFSLTLSVYVIYYILKSYKKIQNDFRQYKELREKSFGVVKDK